LVSVSVNGSIVNALVENAGLIAATDGQVYLTARGRDMLLNTVVNNSGTVEATGLQSRGGEIVLDGGDSGVVSQSGKLLADSAIAQGGKVILEGRNIHLVSAGKTSATGKTGGGVVYVGGGLQGKDGKIRNASKVVMDKAAAIDVSATQSGNGGTAVLWSEDYTNFQGDILARGGVRSGNGGQVETSSRGNLQAFGGVDASAPVGQGGHWLLDPLDVTIVSDADNVGITSAASEADAGTLFHPQAVGAQVSAAKISDQLSAGTSVTVDTLSADGSQAGNITVKAGTEIRKTGGSDTSLTLQADKDITFEDLPTWIEPTSSEVTILATEGKLNLNLLAGNSGEGGTIRIGNFNHFNLNGGDFHAGPANPASGQTAIAFSNHSVISAGNINLDALGGTSGDFYSLIASGNLTIKGPLVHNTGYGTSSVLSAGNLLDITATSGDIRFAAATTVGEGAGGKLTIEGRKGVNIQANSGYLAMNVSDRKQNSISVGSSEGTVNLGGKVQDATNGLRLNSVDISSAGDTKLDGLTQSGKAARLVDVTLKAGGNIDISGIAKDLAADTMGGAASNGVTLTNSRLTSGGNVTLTGTSGSDPANPTPDNALTISGSTITASATGKIVLQGTTKSVVGVKINDSTLSAASLEVHGVATDSGRGFS
ncbi:filamentous hemagglutinin, partial [Ralstonia pseudosolanacearum]|uniref:filamentous hemagglutinin n=1 Tax=Ralstonia pseudosolanacearum TaxID=1310165 RepID=UPI003D29D8F2